MNRIYGGMKWYHKTFLGAAALAGLFYIGIRNEKRLEENPFSVNAILPETAHVYKGAFGNFRFSDIGIDGNGSNDFYCILFAKCHAFCRRDGESREYNRVQNGTPEGEALAKARPDFKLAEPIQ